MGLIFLPCVLHAALCGCRLYRCDTRSESAEDTHIRTQ